MKNTKLWGILGILLVFGLVFAGCPTGTEEDDPPPSSLNAQFPVISTQPLSGVYSTDNTVNAELSVTAAVTDGGTLSYQWYSNTSASTTGGTAIDSATSASYTANALAYGTYYYFVKVTNTNDEAIGTKARDTLSDAATVTVQAVPTANMTLTLDNATKGQFIRGVGGMSDQAFIYGNGAWTGDVTTADIQNMFGHGPQELGLNMYRLLMYPYLEEGIANYTGPQGALTAGDPDQGIVDDTTLYQPGQSGGSQAAGTIPIDNSDYYDIIKKINELDGYVMLCPWTVPQEFTTGSGPGGLGTGTGAGSQIDPTKYNELADWYVSYIQNLIDHGAPIFALSVQNEPDWPAGYDGCIWSGTAQRDLIKILGPKLEAAGIKGYGGGREWAKIWIGCGDNAGLPGAAGDAVINDTEPGGAAHYVEIATRHNYGSMAPYTNGIAAIADPAKYLREIWQTEHCDTTGANARNPEAVRNSMSGWNWAWHIANETYNSFALNKESAFIWWTAKRFYGFIGDGSYTTTNGAVLPRGHVMAHFGKYVLNTNMIDVTATGSFASNAGINAGGGSTELGDTSATVIDGTNFNPTAFQSGNSDTAGQNQPTTKVMAFEADDGSFISVVAFTPTRNSGEGGQDAGNVRIDLPSGFAASKVEVMRSNATAKQVKSAMNVVNNGVTINLPRNEIVSVKFIK